MLPLPDFLPGPARKPGGGGLRGLGLRGGGLRGGGFGRRLWAAGAVEAEARSADSRRSTRRLLPRAHARARMCASATEMCASAPCHPCRSRARRRRRSSQRSCAARWRRGRRRRGGQKRPRLPRGATVAAARGADATRSPAAAHSSPRARGMARQWEGVGRARAGGAGGQGAALRRRRPFRCTPPPAQHRPVAPFFLHAEATWLRARRRRHQGHREDLAREVLRPERLVRRVLTSL